ncbi:MAG TPA: SurA N-terminal domain-containing protein, partial [Pirellulales bacterium]|nr:SurA N-terminal domain-containing protein [Pirellulales bacterium]
MAGLFDTYRRHNKLIFGLIFASMVLFMVGTMFVSNNRGGGNQDPVVATWRYGTIRLSDVIRCQRQQNLINRFRAEAMMALVGQDQEVPPVTQTVALEQLLLTKRAESLGIVVSDARVLEAIKEMTFGVLPNEMTRKILAKIGLSEELLVQIARSNIMASRVRSMFFNTVRAEPPAEQWNAYLREHRKITAEVATLPVEDYVASVPSPTETQLHEFYEKNKDAVAHDGEPGFRLPYRAAFQYFVAQQPIFLAKAQAAVTDAEIQDYYDKHKADFKEPDLPQDPDKKDADKKDTDKKDADKKDADKKDTDKKDDAAGTEKKEAAPVKEPAKPSEAKTDDKKPPVPSADSAIKDAD